MGTKHLNRRHFLRLTSAGAAAATLTACQPSVVEKVVKETVVVEVDRAAEHAAAVQGNIIWDTYRGIGTSWNEERIATFQAKFPDVQVEFRPIAVASQQEAYGKQFTMFAAGDLGDVFAFDPSHFHFRRAATKGVLLPLDDYVARDNLDLTQWFEQFIVMQRHKGKMYGLPSWGWSGGDCFIINELQFAEMGIPVPDPAGHDVSMETIAEWANTFYIAGKGPGEVERYGIAVGGGESSLSVICRAFSGDLINADGSKSLVLEEGALEGLRWAYDLNVVDKVCAQGADFPGRRLEQGAWVEGKLTMVHGGSWQHGNAMKSLKEMPDPKLAKQGNLFFPKQPDGRIPCQIRGGTWNVNSKSKAPDVAWEFVKHLTNLEGSVGLTLVGGGITITRPDMLPVLKASSFFFEWFEENLLNGIVIHEPGNSRGREYTSAVNQIGAKLMDWRNPVPFDEGVQELNDAIQKALDLPEA